MVKNHSAMTLDPTTLTALILALASGYGSLRARMTAIEKKSAEHTEHLKKLYTEIRKLTTK